MRKAAFSLLVLGALSLLGASRSGAADFKVVVNAANPVAQLNAATLERLFLKKETRWAHGEKVVAVDLTVTSPVRAAFTRQVHHKEVGAIQSYWQTQIFSGRGTPPPSMGSDAEVLALVRGNPGGVGYVSADAALGDGVKTIRLSE